MPYIFGKLWHLAIIWAIRKAFQCILQGVRILLANHTRISPTSENDSYSVWAAIFAHTFMKVFARASISANIIAINCENVCARFDLCLDLWKSKQKYLRMLGFAQIFAQMLVKKNTLASICALICANIFENPCARSDLRFDLRKSMRTLWFAL